MCKGGNAPQHAELPQRAWEAAGQEHEASAEPLLPAGICRTEPLPRHQCICTAGPDGSPVKLAIMDLQRDKTDVCCERKKGPEARDEAKVRKFASKSAMAHNISTRGQKNQESQSVLQNEALAWLQQTSGGAPAYPELAATLPGQSPRTFPPAHQGVTGPQ